MMDSFLSIWPRGLFGLNQTESAGSLMLVESTRAKRGREEASPPPTPTLVTGDTERPVKRFRGLTRTIPIAEEKKTVVAPISKLPEDVLAHCLGFLGGVEDRFRLQSTSKQFRRISNSAEMREKIQVGGDRKTGLHGIIQETDTPETASENLKPYAEAGNLEAIYMLGIIKSYCHQDVEGGIRSLKYAASKGYVRASYALGLALRDSQPGQAQKYMKDAADQGYIPALQELLPARKMKAKYGEPKADELRLHLDPLCLNRLLSRYYVQSADLREFNTSHCWNPLCGRWAFKATVNPAAEQRRLGFSFRRTSTASNSSLRSTDAPDSDATETETETPTHDVRVSRMKMCSRCCRAKYCSKLCQVYDWRSGRHKMECQFL